MEREKEVLDFIVRRWRNTDAHWTDGNCYWFAEILCARFPYLHIFYMPIQGHFVAGDGAVFFDVNGLVDVKTDNPIMFEELRQNEPNWYCRIIRDCVN